MLIFCLFHLVLQKEQHRRRTQRRRAWGSAWRRALLLSLRPELRPLCIPRLEPLCTRHFIHTFPVKLVTHCQFFWSVCWKDSRTPSDLLLLFTFRLSQACFRLYFPSTSEQPFFFTPIYSFSCSYMDSLATTFNLRSLFVFAAQPLGISGPAEPWLCYGSLTVRVKRQEHVYQLALLQWFFLLVHAWWIDPPHPPSDCHRNQPDEA